MAIQRSTEPEAFTAFERSDWAAGMSRFARDGAYCVPMPAIIGSGAKR